MDVRIWKKWINKKKLKKMVNEMYCSDKLLKHPLIDIRDLWNMKIWDII